MSQPQMWPLPFKGKKGKKNVNERKNTNSHKAAHFILDLQITTHCTKKIT